MMTITNAIADLVRASAVYDLNTPRMSAEAEDFARWFLEDSKTGYCVHFATAAAVLLRAAGIEARLVEGYLIRISAGETVAVTSGNAHAWVEYHVPGIGWLPLETTPPAAQLQPAQLTEEKNAPNESTPPFPGATQAEISDKTKDPHMNRICLPILFSLLCFSCLLLQRTVRIRIRNTRHRSGSANHCALEKWKHIVLLSQLSREPVPETIEQLALRARFSQHILTVQELAILDQHIQDRVAHLRTLPFPLRLFHRLIRAAY